ncbi:hypothetical protein [Brevibacterium sp. UCMA 11754]|uniref:hypothetical protein n=1 Tax=Brevibacterium sp. UCMA 11754 TaxID=2749198 RepID=UPI001F39E789|nr:hypothetical protein [Brevibacterium sp. UCMA 11754]MCF2571111.1 hypothetical protein [Brevibacterium sp. UCMA 11754]
MRNAHMDGRICLVELCIRSTEKTRCRFHDWAAKSRLRAWLAGEEHFDPLTTHDMDISGWWVASQKRMRKLESIRSGDMWSRSSRAAHREINEIRLYAASQLVEPLISQWRSQKGHSAWRLPPDGWLAETMIEQYPYMQLDEVSGVPRDDGDLFPVLSFESWIDSVARQQQEMKSPTPAPFTPVTRRRRVDDDARNLLDEQEIANAGVIERHKSVIHAYKHHERPPEIQDVFDDPEANLDLEDGLVVYHQEMRPCVGTSELSRLSLWDQWARWSFDQHQNLQVGDVVRYEHARSATTKTWWFGSVLGRDPHWLNKEGEENGLRLELAPKRGLFLSERSEPVVKSHLMGENELILPGDTWWQVVGVGDVVQANSRLGDYDSNERLRGIQMVEVNPEDFDQTSNVKLLSAKSDGKGNAIFPVT